MARSNYIYVVCVDGFLESAFTVKYEMVSSLPKDVNKLDTYEIFRVKDGGSRLINIDKCNKTDITEDIIREYYNE